MLIRGGFGTVEGGHVSREKSILPQEKKSDWRIVSNQPPLQSRLLGKMVQREWKDRVSNVGNVRIRGFSQERTELKILLLKEPNAVG